MSTPHHQHGLTLVEVGIAMAISALITALALPSLGDILARRKLHGWAQQLVADIRLARSEAILHNAPVRISFASGASGTCYVIHTGRADGCPCAPGPATTACPASARIKHVVFEEHAGIRLSSNVRSMLFEPRGTVTPAATITVHSDRGGSIRHVVNILGRVRSCAVPAAAQAGATC